MRIGLKFVSTDRHSQRCSRNPKITALICLILIGFVVQSVSAEGLAKAGCTPNKHAPIDARIGLKYDAFREKLIATGWQPILINIMQRGEVFPGNMEAMVDAGFNEVISCYPTGQAGCEFEFLDVYGNRLLVETIGEVWEDNPFPSVVKYYFKC